MCGRSIVICVIFLVASPIAVAVPPAADGVFDEWTPATLIATDPTGDAANVFDVTEVHALNQGGELFVHFDTTATLNIQSGPGGEDTLRLELGLPDAGHLTIDFRNRFAYTDGQPANFVPWSDLSYVSMSTYAADRFELRVDLGALGLAVDDSITIDFSGSDALSAPVAFTLSGPPEAPPVRSPQRDACTTFRIASLNTLAGGLLDAERGPAIGRLVQAAAADIYCFQEQNSAVSEIADRLEELDPLGDGGAWNVHTSADTVIASEFPIIAIPHPRDAAAVVDLGDDGAVGIFSIHPRCCGYIGNGQDLDRIEEMEEIVATIQDLRDSALGMVLEPYRYVPIMIIGDWNLVGSRGPLDLVEDPGGPNQQHRLLPHLVGSNVHTWRSSNEFPGSFSPGLLDLLTYSSDLLVARNGFTLDSSELGPELLQELQLEPDDSLASDHLMLVGDFSTFARGDLDGNGETRVPDLIQLLADWGPCALCPTDLTGDGFVRVPDLIVLLANWGPCE